VLELIFMLLDIYKWVIIAAALITWVSPDPRNPVVTILRRVTEPVLAPARRLLPPWKTGGLDFSPLIVIFAIQLVEWGLPRLLFQAQP
jgi:YggT family protein